ncbi:thioesterase family protein [Mycobacterium spongiae]|uniref:Thioesterase n=1 Tax=Mycobacterium spongiae TaxID=886343 RepID=A0A975PYK9_9MYCO|nr:hotdog domain-containing protein [Mycobacterium spongiae]QUR69355.1 thioesterase [Mycobacterium spongiae]
MQHEVTTADTAEQMGSGDVPVLATPRLIAWLEAATVQAAAGLVGPGQTSVGIAVRIEHQRATKVGGTIEAMADPPTTSGRRLSFVVKAIDESGHVVAVGEIDRVIVDREKFLVRAAEGA